MLLSELVLYAGGTEVRLRAIRSRDLAETDYCLVCARINTTSSARDSKWECVARDKAHSIAIATYRTPLKMEAKMHNTVLRMVHGNFFTTDRFLDSCRGVLEGSKSCNSLCSLVIRNGIS